MAKACSLFYIPLNIRPALMLHRRGVCYTVANSSPCPIKGRPLAAARKQKNDSVVVKSISTGGSDINVPEPSVDTLISTDNHINNEIKMQATVSGARTQVIFDNVFSKMVEAAQPIPGFRRSKGGKTPDVPKDILLHILGHEKVKKQTIKKIINVIVSEYVMKEGLKISENLRVVESYEELEASFKPGNEFVFNAILQLQ